MTDIFTDGIFKSIFLNEYCCILIEISLKFVPKCPALVWVMVSCAYFEYFAKFRNMVVDHLVPGHQQQRCWLYCPPTSHSKLTLRYVTSHWTNYVLERSVTCWFLRYWRIRLLTVITLHEMAFFSRLPWWRHQMETFSALLAICEGNSPVAGEFPSQRSVTRSFVVFFDLRLNKRLIRQSRRWWFDTPSRPLLRRYDNRSHCWGNDDKSVSSKSTISQSFPCSPRALFAHVRPYWPWQRERVNTLRRNSRHFADEIFKYISWMKIIIIIFHWNLFPVAHLSTIQHWFR